MSRVVRTGLATTLAVAACLTVTSTASASTSLVAAYEEWVPGQGFEIVMVDTATGANIPVPAAINTTADELHPALSPDGRYLAFTRMTLLPQLNGDIVPPAERTTLVADLSRVGTELAAGLAVGGAGPTFTGSQVATGLRRAANLPVSLARLNLDPGAPALPDSRPLGQLPFPFNSPPGPAFVHDRPSAFAFTYPPVVSSGASSTTTVAGFTAVSFSTSTGSVSTMVAVADTHSTSTGITRGLDANNASHPVVRAADRVVAFDACASSGCSAPPQAGIKTKMLGQAGSPQEAPPAINTDADETMPAWGPDGTKLGFVRMGPVSPRELLIYDLNPALQTVVNPGLSLGAAPPTAQLRAFQRVWGGTSLATMTRPLAVALSCSSSCLSAVTGLIVGTLSPGTLTPVITPTPILQGPIAAAPLPGTRIGIVVSRVLGTTSVLGRKIVRIKRLGRVPLGKARAGRNRFAWDGRVGGVRLRPGRHLLTFRALNTAGRVLTTTQAIAFRVERGGRISGVRSVPP